MEPELALSLTHGPHVLVGSLVLIAGAVWGVWRLLKYWQIAGTQALQTLAEALELDLDPAEIRYSSLTTTGRNRSRLLLRGRAQAGVWSVTEGHSMASPSASGTSDQAWTRLSLRLARPLPHRLTIQLAASGVTASGKPAASSGNADIDKVFVLRSNNPAWLEQVLDGRFGERLAAYAAAARGGGDDELASAFRFLHWLRFTPGQFELDGRLLSYTEPSTFSATMATRMVAAAGILQGLADEADCNDPEEDSVQ